MVSPQEMGQTLTAVLIFLMMAHLGGFVFGRIRQPIVIGEIMGGLLLGPTFLGWFSAETYQSLFVHPTRVPIALTLIYNFGLLVMMFCSGLEAKTLFRKGAKKPAVILALGGTALPLALSYMLLSPFDFDPYMGPRGTHLTLNIILGCAMAVTSLPVLSRIFMDLGVMKSAFASLVLSASLIDDVILYVLMSFALTLAAASAPDAAQGSIPIYELILKAVIQMGFVVICIKWAHRPLNWLINGPLKFLLARSPTSALLVVMLIVTLGGQLLGVPYVLGAFVAGICASRIELISDMDRESLRNFSFSFFIPIYFAFVGFRLDLHEELILGFTFGFIVLASLIKGSSIWVSSKLAGYSSSTSFDLATTMNARGGPGIVLASVALDAQIINGKMYVTLVLLAIVTSMAAGSWLQWRITNGAFKHEIN